MLVHYIFVRKDLPLGTLAAMVTHAAGESGALYGDEYDGRFRGATAVVLEAENEQALTEIREKLFDNVIDAVDIRESGGDYHGQLMAIGLVPAEREQVGELLKHYKILRTCLDNQPSPSLNSSNPNETNQSSEETPTVACESTMGLNCCLAHSASEEP